MADASPYFTQRRFTADNSTWLPIGADYTGTRRLWVINLDASIDLKFRTDSGDANTEDLIPAGNSKPLGSAPRSESYRSGEAVGFVQAASGTVSGLRICES